MTIDLTIALWQVPVLVGAAIVAVVTLEWLLHRLVRRRPPRVPAPEHEPAPRYRVRDLARPLGLLVSTLIISTLLVVALQALGTSTADNITAIASSVLGLAGAWLTVLSFHTWRERWFGAGNGTAGSREPEQAQGDPP